MARLANTPVLPLLLSFCRCAEALRPSGLPQVHHKPAELTPSLKALVVADVDEMPDLLAGVSEYKKTVGINAEDSIDYLTFPGEHVLFLDLGVKD